MIGTAMPETTRPASRAPLTPPAAASVLLISGPSGAGKSTFIRSLASRQLGPEIDQLLPRDSASWPVIEANDLLKRGLSHAALPKHGSPQDGVILHYDTFFIRRTGIADYVRDPVYEVISQAADIVVVDIQLPPEQLRIQFRDRLSAQLRSKGLLRSLWARHVRRHLKRASHRLAGKGLPETTELYSRSGQIESCYREWEAFLDRLMKSKPQTRIVRVTPDRAVATADQFCLIGT